MKIHLLFAAVFTVSVITSNATLPLPMPALVTKEWHISPPKAVTSRLFGVIEWNKLPMIKLGLSEKELRVISPMMSPFKEIHVLLYSTSPRGVRYEVGILMADGRISDLSYKAVSESFENSMFGSGYLPLQSYAERKTDEQAGSGQPANHPESKLEASDKPQPEADRHSR